MDEAEKPLVTCLLLAYNQERYVRDAVEACLQQTYSPLEIIFSDDCSTDSTFDVIRSIAEQYQGPHTVQVNRNPSNLGLASHFSLLCERARGEIIVVAAGDDISAPQRAELSVRILTEHPDASVVSFRHKVIDDSGHALTEGKRRSSSDKLQRVSLSDFLARRSAPLSGASRAFRRAVFDRFGPLDSRCPTEDTPMLLRALMLGNAYYSEAVGISYRKHDSNLSGAAMVTRLPVEEIHVQYLTDIRRASSMGILSDVRKRELEAWAEQNLKRRRMRNRFHQSPSKLTEFALRIAPSPLFGGREKLVLLRDALVPRLRIRKI